MSHFNTTDIAVIGIAGMFPKADSVQKFWENMLQGMDCITRNEPIETYADGYSLIHAFGAMDNIYAFDNDFFGISDNEALNMEPQERKMLECVYSALEDAGCVISQYKGKIGIVCGAPENEYYLRDRFFNNNETPLLVETRKFLDSGMALAGRISYYLNLTGPSLIVNTACSTSLTAVHLACSMLRNHEADIMIAGGTNISIDQDNYVYIDGMSAKDGYVRAFDKESTGLVPGNAVGAVILKRALDARQDRDHIYAVIKSSSIGNDGNRKIGFTAPSITGEYEVISEAIQRAGIKEHQIGYIETHGTATPLGDAIEVRALKKVFKELPEGKKIPIGSLKSNYGHLNSAAGIAAIIKGCMVLKTGLIPASIHHTKDNPELEEDGPLYVNRNTATLGKDANYVGVSSFGLGGMNAHMVMSKFRDEAETNSEKSLECREELIVYSAKKEEALHKIENKLKKQLTQEKIHLGEVAYTSICGREKYEKRGYMICSKSHVEVYQQLQAHRIVLCICSGKDTDESINILCEYCPGFKQIFLGCVQIITASGHSHPLENKLIMEYIYYYCLGNILLKMGIEPNSLSGVNTGYYACLTLKGEIRIEEITEELLHKNIMEKMTDIKVEDKDLTVIIGCESASLSDHTKSDSTVAYLDFCGSGRQTWMELLQTAGKIWSITEQLNIESLFWEEQKKKCTMPTYPFADKKHKKELMIADDTRNMNREQIPVSYDKVLEIFSTIGEVENISLESRIDELALDSLVLVIIRSKISELFRCPFSIRDLYECETIGHVAEHIKNQRKEVICDSDSEYESLEDLFAELGDK